MRELRDCTGTLAPHPGPLPPFGHPLPPFAPSPARRERAGVRVPGGRVRGPSIATRVTSPPAARPYYPTRPTPSRGPCRCRRIPATSCYPLSAIRYPLSASNGSPPPPQAAVRRFAAGQRPARPAPPVAVDQLGLHRVGRGAARRRALDEAAGGRDHGLHPRGARKRRRPAAGDPRPRQGCDPHGRRGRSHRDTEFDRRARVRLPGRRGPRPHARRAHPLARAASATHGGPRGTR